MHHAPVDCGGGGGAFPPIPLYLMLYCLPSTRLSTRSSLSARLPIIIITILYSLVILTGHPIYPSPATLYTPSSSPHRLFMSDENSWSRKTVRPSLSVSWNQSRHVTLPMVLMMVVFGDDDVVIGAVEGF